MNSSLMPFGMLTVMFRHKGTFATVFLTVMLSAIAYLTFATAKYQSVAELIVRFGDRSIPSIDRRPAAEMTPSDRREIVLSNAEILGSHDLAEATIEAIGLDRLYPDIVADPPTRWSPMDEAVRTFDRSLGVEVGPQNNVISVSFLHPDKSLAPKVLHKLIDLYIARQTKVYQNPQSGFLASEVKQAYQRLSEAQSALEHFKAQWRITDYGQEVQDLLKQRGDVDSSLQVARANLVQAEARKADIAKMLQGISPTVAAPASGEKYRSIDEAETRLAELQAKHSQLAAVYAPGSAALSALNAQIATAQREVASRRRELGRRGLSNVNPVHQNIQTDFIRASADVQGYAGPVNVLAKQLQGIDARLAELQQNRGRFDDLVRQRDLAETTYRTLSAQYEDARVKDNLNAEKISPATVISQPTLPYRPARPRKLVTLVAALFAATVLAVGAVLFREALDDRFTTAAQVAYALDLPVLAAFDQTPILSRPPPRLTHRSTP